MIPNLNLVWVERATSPSQRATRPLVFAFVLFVLFVVKSHAQIINLHVSTQNIIGESLPAEPVYLTGAWTGPRIYGTNLYTPRTITQYTDPTGQTTFSNVLFGPYLLSLSDVRLTLGITNNITGTWEVTQLIQNPAVIPTPFNIYWNIFPEMVVTNGATASGQVPIWNGVNAYTWAIPGSGTFDPLGAALAATNVQQAWDVANFQPIGNYQPLNPNLNLWGAISTNALLNYLTTANYNTNWGAWSTNVFATFQPIGSYQPLSANLTLWSAISTNALLNYLLIANYNTNWGAWSTNIFATFETIAAYNAGWGAFNTNVLGTFETTAALATALSIYAPTNSSVSMTWENQNNIIWGQFTGNGSGLNVLNAGNLSTGTVPTARLPVGTASAEGILSVDGTTLQASGGQASILSVPLADIAQGGATTGQSLYWTNGAWTPLTPVSGGSSSVTWIPGPSGGSAGSIGLPVYAIPFSPAYFNSGGAFHYQPFAFNGIVSNLQFYTAETFPTITNIVCQFWTNNISGMACSWTNYGGSPWSTTNNLFVYIGPKYGCTNGTLEWLAYSNGVLVSSSVFLSYSSQFLAQ